MNLLYDYSYSRFQTNVTRSRTATAMDYSIIDVQINPIEYLLRTNDMIPVEYLLDSGDDILFLDMEGQTPLHLAVLGSFLEDVKIFVDLGANLEIMNSRFHTPLLTAITMNVCSPVVGPINFKIIELLLAAGADIFTIDKRGNSLLHYATDKGDLKLLEFLLQNGLDTNAKNMDNVTALHIACNKSKVEIAGTLLRRGADVNAMDNFGRTPLINAFFVNNEELINKLLVSGAKVCLKNGYGNTPLHYAVLTKNKRLIEILLIKQAQVNEKNICGRTPLHFVAQLIQQNDNYCSYIPVLDSLLTWGGLTTVKDDIGKTPAQYFSGRAEIKALDESHWVKRLCVTSTRRYRYHKQLKACYIEMREIKQLMFGKQSLYEVLFNIDDDPLHTRNKRMRKFIWSAYLERKYPQYASLLRVQYHMTLIRVDLLNEIQLVFNRPIPLPIEVRRKILSQVSNMDLINLYNALKGKDNLSLYYG